MDIIKISVIVPVYNTENYLRDCLESIRRQTLNNIEVIVVDDGSTDSSPTICDSFKKDKRFKIFHNANSGVSSARNFGIEQASGLYCMFVDSDDWLESNACELLYKYAVKTNSDLVIGGHVNESTVGSKNRFIYPDNCVFNGDEYNNSILSQTLGLVGNNLRNPSKLDKLTPIWSRIYKTSIIKNNQIKYIDLNRLPSECLQFNFDFCINAKSAAYLHKIVYHYRRNTISSVTKPYRNDLWKKWKWWIIYMNNYLQSQNVDDTIWSAFYSRICCSIIPLGGNALKLKRYKAIKTEAITFLSEPQFRKAWNKFDYSKCPIYWRLFFWSAKNRVYLLYIFFTWTMRKILDFRKK